MTGGALALAFGFVGVLAAGILVGRYYVPDEREQKRTARHAQIYLRALGHLLARDRERAIVELRRAVAENVSDLEPYFALGALFRSRGEWERAIRIHQALELRARGNKKLQRRAHFELGLDFRTAGMPRRAIRALEGCLRETPKHEPALRALAGLYEQQARYAEAASAWRRLRKVTGERSPRELHTTAAAASQAIAAGDLDAAKRHAREAQRQDETHPHALAAAAEVAEALGKAQRAGERYARVAAVAPELAAVAAEGIRRAERARLGDDVSERDVAAAVVQRLEALEGSAAAAPHLRLVLARCRRESGEDDEAARAYRQLAEEDPELLAAPIALARYALEVGDHAELRRALEALAGEEGALSWAAEGWWRCGFCGLALEAFAWRCAACRQWGWIALEHRQEAFESTASRDRRAERRRAPTASLAGAHRHLEGEESTPGDAEASAHAPSRGSRAGGWMAGAVRWLKPGRNRRRAPRAD